MAFSIKNFWYISAFLADDKPANMGGRSGSNENILKNVENGKTVSVHNGRLRAPF